MGGVEESDFEVGLDGADEEGLFLELGVFGGGHGDWRLGIGVKSLQRGVYRRGAEVAKGREGREANHWS